MRFKIYFQKNFEQSYRKKMKKTTQIGNLVQFFFYEKINKQHLTCA